MPVRSKVREAGKGGSPNQLLYFRHSNGIIMNDHAFYDGDVKAKLDDPKSYSPDGISGSGDEVSFALADHYFAPLLRTLTTLTQ